MTVKQPINHLLTVRVYNIRSVDLSIQQRPLAPVPGFLYHLGVHVAAECTELRALIDPAVLLAIDRTERALAESSPLLILEDGNGASASTERALVFVSIAGASNRPLSHASVCPPCLSRALDRAEAFGPLGFCGDLGVALSRSVAFWLLLCRDPITCAGKSNRQRGNWGQIGRASSPAPNYVVSVVVR